MNSTRACAPHGMRLVPKRAFEDIAVVKAATGLLGTERLSAALLMVDFANPVFSSVREQLLKVVPDDGDLRTSAEEFSDLIARRIRAGSDGQARSEFLGTWDAADEWRASANARLRGYYARLRASSPTIP